MISKLMMLACTLALSTGAYNGPLAGGQPAAQYPAGIDPKSCPNFPSCSSPLVALSQATSLPGVQHDPSQLYRHYQQPSQQIPQQYSQVPQQYNQVPQQYNQIPQQYNPVPQQQYNSIPQPRPQPHQQFAPQQPQYAAQPSQPKYSPEIQNALNRGEYIGDGDYHGEGLAESLAAGPINNNARAYQPAPVQYQQPAQYQAQPQYQPQYRESIQRSGAHQFPAGVDGSACPNYPFCS
ncbi:hypothetical protein WA026_002317 [Henosepilachna vigintioctopunctata]|uniref:Cuticle protein CPCFC domain-containing protein n=1 Tax=Henosepilachna vigintioctopunctata TaxID=420089 RepID=A0AAW1U0G3_9CUCU